MRLTKILVSAIAVGVATLAFATTETQAAGDESLVTVSCSGGVLTAKPTAPWHANTGAPWKWDKGEKTSLTEKEGFAAKGAKCEGTLKAYVCNDDKSQCKGPIPINVK